MKRTTLFSLAILLAFTVSAQNWALNGTTWEKTLNASVLEFSAMDPAALDANIFVAAGNSNPNPTIVSTANGYFAVTGGQIAGAADETVTKQAFTTVNVTDLGGYTGKIMRFAATGAVLDAGDTDKAGKNLGYVDIHFYRPTQYTYTGYGVKFSTFAYLPATNNSGLKLALYDLNAGILAAGTAESPITCPQNTWTDFTKSGGSDVYRGRIFIPNTGTLIAYFKDPKFILTSAAKPTVRTININNASNGTVTAQYTEVLDQDRQVFTFAPDAGYGIKTVTYNGIDVITQLVGNKYTTPLLTANATLVVEFDLNTNIKASETATFKAYAKQGMLVVENIAAAQTINVYSLAGKLVYNVSNKTEITVSLPQGVYFVKVNNKTQKVIL